MKRVLLVLSFSLIVGKSFSQKQASRENVKALLELTGSGKLGVQVLENIVATMRNSNPEVPAVFWEDFIKEAKPETLVELVIPVYVKHFADEEIVQLIEFYNTPLGKKVISTLPLISQESYAIGAKWGGELAEKVIKKLQEKGYSEGN